MKIILFDIDAFNLSSRYKISAVVTQLHRLKDKGYLVVGLLHTSDRTEPNLQTYGYLSSFFTCLVTPNFKLLRDEIRSIIQLAGQSDIWGDPRKAAQLQTKGQGYFIKLLDKKSDKVHFQKFGYDDEKLIFSLKPPKTHSSSMDVLTQLDNTFVAIHRNKLITFIGTVICGFIGGWISLFGALLFASGFLASVLTIKKIWYCCYPDEPIVGFFFLPYATIRAENNHEPSRPLTLPQAIEMQSTVHYPSIYHSPKKAPKIPRLAPPPNDTEHPIDTDILNLSSFNI